MALFSTLLSPIQITPIFMCLAAIQKPYMSNILAISVQSLTPSHSHTRVTTRVDNLFVESVQIYLKDYVVFSLSFILLFLHLSFLRYLWHLQAITRVVLEVVSIDFFLHSYSCLLLYDLQIHPFLFKEYKCALSTNFASLQHP